MNLFDSIYGIEHTDKVTVFKRNSPCINNHLRNLICSSTIPSADIQMFLKNAEKQANLVKNLNTKFLTAIKWFITNGLVLNKTKTQLLHFSNYKINN